MREGGTGIATDSVVECVVEFLRFAKCLVEGGTKTQLNHFLSCGSLPQLELSLCSLPLKGQLPHSDALALLFYQHYGF